MLYMQFVLQFGLGSKLHKTKVRFLCSPCIFCSSITKTTHATASTVYFFLFSVGQEVVSQHGVSRTDQTWRRDLAGALPRQAQELTPSAGRCPVKVRNNFIIFFVFTSIFCSLFKVRQHVIGCINHDIVLDLCSELLSSRNPVPEDVLSRYELTIEVVVLFDCFFYVWQSYFLKSI